MRNNLCSIRIHQNNKIEFLCDQQIRNYTDVCRYANANELRTCIFLVNFRCKNKLAKLIALKELYKIVRKEIHEIMYKKE